LACGKESWKKDSEGQCELVHSNGVKLVMMYID